MSQFLQRVEAALLKDRLLPRGKKILVAVSGGADSQVLLAALHSLADKYRWQLSVAHFNHRLRGRASQADESLVCRTAAQFSLPFFSGQADVARFARQAKISLEMAARRLRHEFLARIAREQKISTIALAHHADDQVELFFLRLLRGAGGAGLAGMKSGSPSPVDSKLRLVRPLLGFTKADLIEFAGEQNIAFREDASNLTANFLRNRIRNELLPLLQKEYQPGLNQTVLRLMEITGAETEWARQTAREWEQTSRRPDFAGLPVAVQRKVIQAQLHRLGLVSDFDLIEQLRLSVDKPVSVSATLAVARDTAGMIVCKEMAGTLFSGAQHRLKFTGQAGRVNFGGQEFRWQIRAGNPAISLAKPANREFFDADRVGGEIILRHWQTGDRFRPIGMKSAVKLQNLFVNAKIPAARRRSLVVAATAAGEIFWVEGLRIGEKYKLTSATRRQLCWGC